MEAKEAHYKEMWAYFSPDGFIQFRTISDTKKNCRLRLPQYGSEFNWKHYEDEGYFMKKVKVDISILNP